MPAPVQPSDTDPASRPEKSNSWSTAQRMDIFNRRQQGEKWDTIIVDYPNRSKHAMQQQYSKTPPNAGGRRRKAPSTASPAVPTASKRASKRQTVQDDADQSDAKSDANSTSKIASKIVGGKDGAAETDEEPESPPEQDSARKKRLSKRLKKTVIEDDEPVTARPRRTRASGINYNVLQNSGYDQDDQDEAVALHPAAEAPVRLSKIIALRTGFPKPSNVQEPDPKTKKLRKSLNIAIDDQVTRTPTAQDEEYTGRRMSTRGRKFINGKSDYLPSPLSFAADGDTNSFGGRRKRGFQDQDQDQEQLLNRVLGIRGDSKATRSSRKRKNSETDSIETRPRKVVAHETSPQDEHDHPARGHTKRSVKEHLGFLSNGQPRQRRRRRTRAEMEVEETTPTTGTKQRRNKYQFPYLEGYNGPPPPDMATILARQEDHERQNPARETDSEPESTSSSLMSLDDEDDTEESQLQEPDSDPNEEAISPLTRPTVDEQLPAESTAVAVALRSGLQPAQSTISSPLKMAEFIFFAEDIEKGRQNARNLQAAREAEKTAYDDNVQASANALAKTISDNNELTRELESLRKERDSYRSKAEKLPHLKQELATQRERRKSVQEELKKLTASETALVNEKQRNEQLKDELERSRLEMKAMSDEMAKKFAELNKIHSDYSSTSRASDDATLTAAADSKLAQERERVKQLTEDLRQAKDDTVVLQAERDDYELENEKRDAANAEIKVENTILHGQLAELSTKYEELLHE
ncbi:MAG: hypothetical protein Q9224_005086, partial [Gallowayella concinna]